MRPPRDASAARRCVLVTGGAGFIGSNLADRLAREGHDVIVFDALTRLGVEANLDWLRASHPRRIKPVIADIRDRTALTEAVGAADAVFHFAAQVAVTTSLEDPVADFEVNAAGTLSLLECLRRRTTPAPLLFASTNKVYGNLSDVAIKRTGKAYVPADEALRRDGIGETRSLDFHTPYGCSKGAAEQYVLDYARSFGVPAAVLRMSCIYGPRQIGTEDQGWVAHFLLRAMAGQPITIFGDGCQVRDVLHVDDAIDAYLAAWRSIDTVKGSALNLGGSPANAVSLLQVIAHIERLIGRSVRLEFRDWRPGDQRWYVSDTRRIRAALRLNAPRPWITGVAALAQWLQARHSSASPAPADSEQTIAALS